MGTNKTLGGGASRGTTMDYKEYLSFLSEAGLVGDKGAIDRKLMPAHREPPPPNPDGPVSLSAKGGARIFRATSPQSRRLAARRYQCQWSQ